MESKGRSRQTLALATGMIVCMAVGAAVGAWFATHYRIVPVAAVEAPPVTSATAHASPALAHTPPGAPPSTGPFAFRFTPGETLEYVLKAKVSGQGFEDIGPSPVNLGIDGGLTMKTVAVDAAGVGDLSLTYDRMGVAGEFMGSPFEMDYGDGQTRIGLHGSVPVDTRKGIGSTQGIDQVKFLEDPVRMRVDAHGRVLDVSGGAGWAGMLREVPGFSPVEFPDAELRTGLEWESNIAMPVPGVAQAIPTRVRNKVIGYQRLGNRYCAIIEQEIRSNQRDGSLRAPDSALGKEAEFNMPVFDLSGRNRVYFDVDRGQLAHSAGSYRLTIKIGSMLGQAGDALAQALGQITQGLTGEPGASQNLLGSGTPNAGSLDLSLNFDTLLSLKDVAAAGTRP